MTKKKRVIFIIGFVLAAAALTHFMLYVNIALNRAADYRDDAIEAQVNFTVSPAEHYKDLVNYEDLSAMYKFNVSESDFAAGTDAECLELYRKIIKSTHDPESHSFYSTHGMQMGTAYEGLTVDGVKYHIKHDLDIKANYFTFEPYIAKWSISISTDET